MVGTSHILRCRHVPNTPSSPRYDAFSLCPCVCALLVGSGHHRTMDSVTAIPACLPLRALMPLVTSRRTHLRNYKYVSSTDDIGNSTKAHMYKPQAAALQAFFKVSWGGRRFVSADSPTSPPIFIYATLPLVIKPGSHLRSAQTLPCHSCKARRSGSCKRRLGSSPSLQPCADAR